MATCPRCGGDVHEEALQCPTCGLVPGQQTTLIQPSMPWTILAAAGPLLLASSEDEYAVYDDRRTYGRWPKTDEGYRFASETYSVHAQSLAHGVAYVATGYQDPARLGLPTDPVLVVDLLSTLELRWQYSPSYCMGSQGRQTLPGVRGPRLDARCDHDVAGMGIRHVLVRGCIRTVRDLRDPIPAGATQQSEEPTHPTNGSCHPAGHVAAATGDDSAACPATGLPGFGASSSFSAAGRWASSASPIATSRLLAVSREHHRRGRQPGWKHLGHGGRTKGNGYVRPRGGVEAGWWVKMAVRRFPFGRATASLDRSSSVSESHRAPCSLRVLCYRARTGSRTASRAY